MRINSTQFRVLAGDKVRLTQWSTWVTPRYKSKEDYTEILAEHWQSQSCDQNSDRALTVEPCRVRFPCSDQLSAITILRGVRVGSPAWLPKALLRQIPPPVRIGRRDCRP